MKRIALVLVAILSSACAAKSADTAAAPATADAAPSRAGTYALSTDDFVASPEGCRATEHDPEAWSLEMADPASGSWSATERYGDKSNPYTCAQDGEGFSCTSEAGFDYGSTGVDADVRLDIRYDGEWGEPGSIAGSYELAFTCEGSQCADVAGQWGVNGFPCSNEGTFEGSR